MATNTKHVRRKTKGLYTSDDLLKGFDRDDPQGYLKTWDFRVFRQFVKDGGDVPKQLRVRQRQAKHDADISNALRRYLNVQTHKRLVGVMGGHGLNRTSPAYTMIAKLARVLAQQGFLIVAGGGPGAMEAAHLGAAVANEDESVLLSVIDRISSAPSLPYIDHLLENDGTLAAGGDDYVKAACKWLLAAIEAKESLKTPIHENLAIPTWKYGSEPITPFASAYAKYFQNSIREEALVTDARAGIIYAQGGGGTLREIFEDLEQNYYAKDASAFTPMIFADPDSFWQKDAEFDQAGKVKVPGIKLDDKIERIIRYARATAYKTDADQCIGKIIYSTDVDKIIALLEGQSSVAEKRLDALLAEKKRPLDEFAGLTYGR